MDWETTIKTLRMAVDCIGPTITALGAIALFFKRVRKYLYLVFIHKPEMDKKLYAKVDEILNRIGKIESELRLNDDSTVKDAVARLEAYRRYSATNSMSLIFELDKTGNIVLVTDALCQLVETVRAEDLKGQNWRQFVYIEDEPRVSANLCTAVKTGSSTRTKVRIINSNNISRGDWYVRLNAVTRPDNSVIMYIGLLYPADELATSIYTENNWK